MKTIFKFYLVLVVALGFISCGDSASSDNVDVTQAGSSFFIDTTLQDHQVIVVLRNQELIPLQENFFSVLIDGKPRMDAHVSTQKVEALMKKSDTANALVIVPSAARRQIKLDVRLPNDQGVPTSIGQVTLPVAQQ